MPVNCTRVQAPACATVISRPVAEAEERHQSVHPGLAGHPELTAVPAHRGALLGILFGPASM